MTDNHDREAKLLSLSVHELRTPASVVAGYLRMLLRHFGDSLTDQQRMLLEQAEKSCGQLSALLADLSELSQWEGGRVTFARTPVALATLLADVAKDVHEGQERGVSLGLVACDANVRVLGDATRLATAFHTLLTAALRERADTVSVVVACRVTERPDGSVVRVAIGDAGDVDTLLDDDGSKVFDECRGGLGFRLLLASRVIAAHGGQIASPVAERGRFSLVVSLPVAPDAEISG
jgi:two-component system, sensor histidine kinase and response regulator